MTPVHMKYGEQYIIGGARWVLVTLLVFVSGGFAFGQAPRLKVLLLCTPCQSSESSCTQGDNERRTAIESQMDHAVELIRTQCGLQNPWECDTRPDWFLCMAEKSKQQEAQVALQIVRPKRLYIVVRPADSETFVPYTIEHQESVPSNPTNSGRALASVLKSLMKTEHYIQLDQPQAGIRISARPQGERRFRRVGSSPLAFLVKHDTYVSMHQPFSHADLQRITFSTSLSFHPQVAPCRVAAPVVGATSLLIGSALLGYGISALQVAGQCQGGAPFCRAVPDTEKLGIGLTAGGASLMFAGAAFAVFWTIGEYRWRVH